MSKEGPPVQTSRFSSETADERSKPRSSHAFDSISERIGTEPPRLITGIPSILPTISTFDTDTPRTGVVEGGASTLEHFTKGSRIEEPPLFTPTSFSKTMTDK
ncbi:hypothetical protein AMTR_s00034p00217660 [Amborella trichopoda]|uniref:Uncharacterized protein n=1 Tax=Amborella trichopoda TaxID=13333 RepID=W1PWJ5_AMBTC|nr:hypothetical protein AMTR_s00034p00217660 [Amborella trichopoda]